MRLKRLCSLVALAVAFIAAAPARAAFHLYVVAEAFSSADGSVQFIRLHCAFSGQNFVSGQTVTCSDGATTNTFTFPSNLNTAVTTLNSDVLLATAGFASLPGGITPDYIIPSNFLFLSGGTISFAGISTMPYTALPTDGQHSMTPGNVQIINTPKNFARQAGSVNVPAGACCNGAACTTTIASTCAGTFSAGLSCASNPCAPTTGACCRGSTCSVSTPAACTGTYTAFVSVGSACNASGPGGSNTTPCCKADFNHTSGIAVQDIFDFLNAWFASSAAADFNGGGLDVQDIFDFINAWLAGC